MPDPFRPNQKSQLIREAQIGLTVLAILLSLFVYVAFYRITGRGRQLPEHVRNAPVAEQVWPGASPGYETPMVANNNPTPRRIATQGSSLMKGTRIENQSIARIPQSTDVPAVYVQPPFAAELSLSSKAVKPVEPTNASPVTMSRPIELASVPKRDVRAKSVGQGKPNVSENETFAKRFNPLPSVGGQAKPDNQFAEASPSEDTRFPSSGNEFDLAAQSPKVAVDKRNDFAVSPKTVSGESTNQFAVAPAPQKKTLTTLPVNVGNGLKVEAVENSNSFSPLRPGKLRPSSTEGFSVNSDLNANVKLASNETPVSEPVLVDDPFADPSTIGATTTNGSAPGIATPKVSALDLASNSFEPSGFKPQPPKLKTEALETVGSFAATQRGLLKEISPLRPNLPMPKPTQFKSSKSKDTEPSGGEPQMDSPHPVSHFEDSTVSSAETVGVVPQRETLIHPMPSPQAAKELSTTYIVRENDSFWSISEKHYGDGRFFRALYELNNKTAAFDRLLPGTKLLTPSSAELVAKFPELCPKADSDLVVGVAGTKSDVDQRFYVTQAGDTLFDIARQRLDQASRFSEIYDMNSIRLDSMTDPYQKLPVGVRLVLPRR